MRGLFCKQYYITHLLEYFLHAVRGQQGRSDREIFDQYCDENAFQTASLSDVIDLFPAVKFPTAELLSLLKK
jgi:hypothetical protein